MKTVQTIALKTGLAALVGVLAMSSATGAFAAQNSKDQWSLRSLWSKPIVHDAAVGTAVGVGAGMLTHQTSVGKGAVAGAVSGAGVGAVRQSKYFNDKPLVRNAVQGAILGTGASYATDSSRLKGAALGAGAGAGYHYLRKYIDDKH